jgi:hypothetical protein
MLMDNDPIRGGPGNHKDMEGSHDLVKEGVGGGGKGRETGASEARERHGEGGRRGGTGRMEEGEETRRTDDSWMGTLNKVRSKATQKSREQKQSCSISKPVWPHTHFLRGATAGHSTVAPPALDPT